MQLRRLCLSVLEEGLFECDNIICLVVIKFVQKPIFLDKKIVRQTRPVLWQLYHIFYSVLIY